MKNKKIDKAMAIRRVRDNSMLEKKNCRNSVNKASRKKTKRYGSR